MLVSLVTLATVTVSANGEEAAGTKKRPVVSSPIAALLEPTRKKHGLPALGGAVVTRERLVGAGATGVRRAGTDRKVTVADRWHLGSCTKAMTATLIGRLVERGELSWKTTLSEALPDLAKVMHPAWRPVTLELLLGNRGGAPETLDAGGLWGRLWAHKGTPTDARRMLAEGVLAEPPVSTPGTKYAYSNAGFALAGHAAETRMKKSWEDLMREEIFTPLGMEASAFGAPGDATLLDHPQGHRTVAGKLVPVPPGPGSDNPPAIGPAGTVHATLGDWARFIRIHLGSGKPLVSKATVRTMHVPLRGQEYGYGWIVASRRWGGTVLTHAGSNTMWYCVTWLAPEKGFAVLVTCNQGGTKAAKACDEAAWALIQWHLKRGKN